MNSFLSAGDPHGDFQLHASTGALSTIRSLDRETRAGYTLEVVATDRGSPALSSTVTVEVKVLDVNDNSPVFIRSSYTVEVSEDAAEGTEVLEVIRNRNLRLSQNTFIYQTLRCHAVYFTFMANVFICQ